MLSEPPLSLLIGRRDCTEHLRQVLLSLAVAAGSAAIGFSRAVAEPAAGDCPADVWLIDNHFAGWPLDDANVLQALVHWLRNAGHHRLHVIGRDFDAVAHAFPRFSRWRRDWSHRIDIHQPAEGALPPGLRVLLAGRQAAQWLDAPDMRLRKVSHPVHLAALRSDIADFLQRCEPGWPVTPLGL